MAGKTNPKGGKPPSIPAKAPAGAKPVEGKAKGEPKMAAGKKAGMKK